MPFTILLVEDNPDHAELAEDCLSAGVDDVAVVSVNNGGTAIERFGTANTADAAPDLILLDLNMPRVSGFDVLEALRSNAGLRHVPIVIVSTSLVAGDIARALSLRANSYSVKNRDFEQWAENLRAIRDYWRKIDRSRLAHFEEV